ncbi:MAG: hopanoid biosynthesis associated radical SAM protein HpnJ [Acidobacteriota bacterium]|nr:MAG: hopanoid biosynthesis associated radical SAM protein HpnJ [Acidobacteriota bacterium]
MKILLLNPPTQEGKGFIREGRCTQEGGVWTTLWPPISLATIGAILERDGHDVTALDGSATGYPRDKLLKDIEREPPDGVVWSTGTPSIATDLSLADEIREVAPSTRTAVFGTHVSALDTSCLEQTPGLDAIFRNEPEATASEWVARLDDVSSWSGVAGLSYRNGDELERTADRPFLEDLDALPSPAWHLFDLDVYRLPLKGSRFLMVTPHRGCPYPCSYCTAQTYYGAKLRRRSIERVRDEIRRNIEVHGVRELFFWSDTFTIDKRYVIELCDAIEPLGVTWASNSRVDTIDSELAVAMRRAGCWMISFGIESGDQASLDRAGKGATVEDAESAVRIAKEAGIKVAGHFVLGIPGETKESLDKTLALAERLPLDFEQFYCAVPFPGSRLYTEAREKGWLKDAAFDRFRQDEALLELPGLTSEEVMAYRQRAYRRFYTRPSVAFGALSMLSPRNLKHVASALKRFLGWTHA